MCSGVQLVLARGRAKQPYRVRRVSHCLLDLLIDWWCCWVNIFLHFFFVRLICLIGRLIFLAGPLIPTRLWLRYIGKNSSKIRKIHGYLRENTPRRKTKETNHTSSAQKSRRMQKNVNNCFCWGQNLFAWRNGGPGIPHTVLC